MRSYRGGPGPGRPTPEEMEQFEQWHRRTTAPANEFPAAVGISLLLGRTGDTAVGITQVEAFSTGFRFTLAVRLRRASPKVADGRLFMLISPHLAHDPEVPLEDRLLLGLEYPDGRRASTLDDVRAAGPGQVPGDDELMLAHEGGGGGELNVDQTFWVAPLPPPGPVAVVLTWPGFGISETRSLLDGAAVRAAGARSQVLWPWEPLRGSPPEPPAPPRPSSGWFAGPPA